jgi:putative ABC transport system ATP-binding protein/lipoprotein-releasing system ATP-binding protein
MNRPKLIVADEPTGNLDEKTGNGVIELLMGLCSSANASLVLVTHNAAHAAKAGRRLVLESGVLVPC